AVEAVKLAAEPEVAVVPDSAVALVVCGEHATPARETHVGKVGRSTEVEELLPPVIVHHVPHLLPERATQQLGELVLPCRFLRLGPLARGEALGTGRIAHLLPLRLFGLTKAEQLATAHEALDADPGVAQHLLNLPHLA